MNNRVKSPKQQRKISAVVRSKPKSPKMYYNYLMSPKSGSKLIYNRERFGVQNQNFIKTSELFSNDDHGYTPQLSPQAENENLEISISELKNIVHIKNQ